MELIFLFDVQGIRYKSVFVLLCPNLGGLFEIVDFNEFGPLETFE